MAGAKKFSQIADGGTIVPATDEIMIVRNGTTDLLVSGLAAVAIPTSIVTSSAAIEGVQFGQYIPQNPSITSITPSSGYLSGNLPVVIVGTGLLSTTSILFGNRRAQWFVASEYQIFCMPAPHNAAGAVTVTVTVAAAPGQTASTATISYTYISATIAGTLTTLYKTQNPGMYRLNQILILGNDGKLWQPSQDHSLPGLADVSAAAFTFTSTFFLVLATANSGTSPQLGLVYADGISRTIASMALGGDGAIWTADSNGSLTRISNVDVGNDTRYFTSTLPLKDSGFSNTFNGYPSFAFSGPDGSLLFIGGVGDGSSGTIWSVDPFNPLDQSVSNYSGNYWLFGCIGSNGNLFLNDANAGTIVEMDANLNIVSTTLIAFIVANPSTFVTDMKLGPDGNLWLSVSDDVSINAIIKVSASDLSIQTSTTINGMVIVSICAGPDGNIWASGSKLLVPADSVVVKLNTSVVILATITLTGSEGSDPARPGGSAGICSGADGLVYVGISGQPDVPLQGSVGKIS